MQKHRDPQSGAPASCSGIVLAAAAGIFFPACIASAGRPLAASGPEPLAAESEVEPGTPSLAFEQAVAGEKTAQEEPGLPIGARAPAFELQDQQGRPVTLASLLEKGPVALVFFRSAGW